MSGAAIIRALLVERAELIALVPALSVYEGVVPQGKALPAISITEVSSNEFRTVARNNPNKQIRERVQVTVLAKGYVAVKRILKATALGAGTHTGMVKGFYVNSVLPEGEGPYIPSADDGIYEQSRDFMVTFVEAN